MTAPRPNRAARRAARRASGQRKPVPGTALCCPSCKSERVMLATWEQPEFYGRELVVCGNCRAAWEPLPPGEPWAPEEPDMAFREPCDNCAFRPGSPEQRDTAKWRAIIASLKGGGSFHCHKGVPIAPESKDGFAYPEDKGKLRLCRGYLNAWVRWLGALPEPEQQ